jgi:hypothetical protein
VRSIHVGSLVPVKTEPAKAVEDSGDHLARRPLHVGIFDPEDEDAAVTPRVEPIEECRARAADVQIASRRRRKA